VSPRLYKSPRRAAAAARTRRRIVAAAATVLGTRISRQRWQSVSFVSRPAIRPNEHRAERCAIHHTRLGRFGGPNAAKIRQQAEELVALAPDVILATGGSTMAALPQATRTVPIVFVQVPDPVGAGFVDSLARPGGNATGFTQFEYGVGAKLLELLKEISPRVTRAVPQRGLADFHWRRSRRRRA
jgi:ABC transporter substrate binding protein